MKKICTAVLSTVLVFSTFSCSKEIPENIDPVVLDLTTKKEKESLIEIIEPALFPEGIEYDKRGDRFLISSVTRGDIGQVKDGEYSVFISNPNFVSTIGIHIDQNTKRLLIPNSNIDGSLAALAAYDLSGKLLFYTELQTLREGAHFANDVTADNRGNAYVTDSFAGIIYKVTPDGEAEIFLEDQTLAPAPAPFGMNGIVYDPRGFLIVGRSNTNNLIRVPLDQPEAWSEVVLDADLFIPDGMYPKSPNEILVVGNEQGGENSRLQTFKTTDKWETATLVEEFLTPNLYTTTVTMKKNVPYVLIANLDILLEGGFTDTFGILRAK